MSAGTGLALTGALLLLNAFFVGAEFALLSARRTKIEPRALAGHRFARITLSAMENISLMMAGAQLGITICSLALGSISEPVIAHLLEVPFAAVRMPEQLLHPVSFAIALSLVTFLHVVLGEMVPKNIALAGPERMAMALGPVLAVIVRVLYPILWLVNGIANLGLRILRVEPKDEVTSSFTRAEVAGLVAESHSGGLIELNDERLLLGALQFGARDVRSVLLPMDTVRTLPEGVSPAAAESVSVEGFSRFPLHSPDGTLTGYVHIKDLLETDPGIRMRAVNQDVVRALPTVSATDSLRSVLAVMQRSGAHLAQVREQPGSGPTEPPAGPPLGVVTLEDVLEELVGVIRDDSRRLTAR